MTKSNAPKLTKCVTSVSYEHAPFYNLANIRKETLTLITRASSDPKKVEAIAETLAVMQDFLAVRAKHGADTRKAQIASDKAAHEAQRAAAAMHIRSDAEQTLKSGKATVASATAILKDLDKE